MEETLLDIAQRLQLERPHGISFVGFLKEHWTRMQTGVTADLEQQWIASLQRGGAWDREARVIPIRAVEPPPSLPPPAFMGNAEHFPFVLCPYPSTTLRYDGAHLPWLQELPDTMTTAMWGSWVEMNPATAAKLGVRYGEVVLVESEAGALEAPALLYPGIHPDVIAMPIGQGRRAGGRYATGRGVNPLQLAMPAFDRMSGAFATGATRVRVSPTGRKGSVILSEQPAMEPAKLIRIEHPKPI
jgi:anaerobic selenocysteine-containing dehydrogenase